MKTIPWKMVKSILPPLVLLALAACCIWGPPGYDFSGWICVAAAILCCAYKWLGRRKQQKWALHASRLLTICIILTLFATVLTLGFILGESKGPEEEVDYIIVLGAGVHGTEPSMILSERIDGAYAYLQEHPNAVAVLSGGQGHGEDISEAACMFDCLTALGIDPQRLWLEERSTSTWENLQFSLAIIKEKTGSYPQRIGLVSNEFHLYRACLLAKEQGVTASGIPARTEWVTLRINYYLREVAALWKYLVLGGN